MTTLVRLANDELTRCESKTIATLPSSRHVALLVGTLTTELGSIGVSFVVNSGLIGLLQTIVKLTGPSTEIDDGGETNQRNDGSVIKFARSRDGDGGDRLPLPPLALSGAELVSEMQVGVRVVRGSDWKWGNQDGPSPSEGTVVEDVSPDGWIRIQWDTGNMNSYRMGKEDKYDLQLAPSALDARRRRGHNRQENEEEHSTGNKKKYFFIYIYIFIFILRSRRRRRCDGQSRAGYGRVEWTSSTQRRLSPSHVGSSRRRALGATSRVVRSRRVSSSQAFDVRGE